MTKGKDGTSLLALQVEIGLTMLEAQGVVALRCLGFAGLWPSNAEDRRRMIAEKPPAFAASALAATMAAMAGKPPADVAGAALAPLRDTTRDNARRLRGLK